MPELEETTKATEATSCLTVSLELHAVGIQPSSLVRTSLDSIGTVSSLSQSTSLASSTGESTHLAVLVDRADDPVDTRIIADLLVSRVHKNDFVVLHGGVLVDPVRVEDAHVAVLTSNLLLGNALQVAFELELVYSLVLGLTEDHTTVNLTLASSTTDTGTDYNVSLLGLVAQTVGLVGTGGTVEGQNVRALTVFPGTNTSQETHGVTLLVTPNLFHVLVATHDVLYNKKVKISENVVGPLGEKRHGGLAVPSFLPVKNFDGSRGPSVRRTKSTWIFSTAIASAVFTCYHHYYFRLTVDPHPSACTRRLLGCLLATRFTVAFGKSP